jgi:hypothetical protein
MAVGFDVNPITPVGAQIKPVQGMSLAEMVNMAGGIQAYKQAQQMNPLLLEQQRSLTGTAEEQRQQSILKTGTDQLALNQKKNKLIADSQISLINDPEIIAAEQNPNGVNRPALVEKVRKAGMTLAANVGIPPADAEALIQPYLDLAANDPGKLRTYYKQRHIQGLDDAARTAVLSPSGVQVTNNAMSTVVSTNPFGEQQPGQAIPGTTVTKVLGPSERTMATTDISGNPVFVELSPTGGPTGRTRLFGRGNAYRAACRHSPRCWRSIKTVNVAAWNNTGRTWERRRKQNGLKFCRRLNRLKPVMKCNKFAIPQQMRQMRRKITDFLQTKFWNWSRKQAQRERDQIFTKPLRLFPVFLVLLIQAQLWQNWKKILISQQLRQEQN